MTNEITQPAQLSITEQDYNKIDSIFANTGVSLPISYDGEPESWQLPVSEEFLTGINAQRKRLRNRNLQIHRQSLALQNGAQNRQSYADGVYRIGSMHKHWKRSITYIRGGKAISTYKDRIWMQYFMKKEPGEDTKVSTVEVARVPLPFGRSEEYSVANQFSRGKALSICALLIAILAWLLTILILPIMLICIAFPSLWVYAGILAQCICLTGVFAIGSTWCYRKSSLWTKWREASRRVVAAIRQREPEFCVEKLISTIYSKTQRLMYADTMEDVADIVSCDVYGFLKDQANVVNCELNNFWFTNYREDGDYMYMDVTLRFWVERDLGSRIERSKQTLMLQLNKAVQGIMSEDLYNDWSIVRIETHEK